MAEDSRLRAACTDATQGPPIGGAEERLRTEVSDLLAQKTTMESEVTSAESRVHRYYTSIRYYTSTRVIIPPMPLNRRINKSVSPVTVDASFM